MVERLAASPRRLQRDLELLLHARLPDEVVEGPRTERPLELLVHVGEDRREELRHAALRSAARRCSAGVEPERIARATFGPTPLTPSRSSKSCRSSAVAKP